MKTSLIPCLLAVSTLTMAFAADTPDKSDELKVSVLRCVKGNRSIVVRFENKSPKPLKILRPIDGSEWGWHMPVYQVSITDSAGNSVPLGGRCGMSGLYGNLKWPNDYEIQILPGDSYEMKVDAAREVSLGGRNTFSFRYTYDPAVKTTRQDPSIVYPDGLWVGTTVSAPLEIDIKKER